jgi:hypothetical protein
MPSPFPGMDPYLENPGRWSDFHLTFNAVVRAQLNRVLPDRYDARLDTWVWVHEPLDESRWGLGKPDIYIAEPESPPGAVAVLPAPAHVVLPDIERYEQRFVRVTDTDHDRVVTVIEMLSPSNKTHSANRAAYIDKRNGYRSAGVNLVEIDLLRIGEPLPMRPRPPCDYHVLISRAVEGNDAPFWPIAIRDRLPTIPIPLDPPVPPVPLDLQRCLDEAYDQSRYNRRIDYTQPPPPPALSDADAAWARELLASRRT